MSAETLGALGVGLLLTAFFVNLLGKIDRDGGIYLALNIAGSGLACYSSVLIDFKPFIVLEGIWCLAALIALIVRIATNHNVSMKAEQKIELKR